MGNLTRTKLVTDLPGQRKTIKREAGNRERHCERCQGSEKAVELRCQPDGTMICSRCKRAHDTTFKPEKPASHFPAGYRVFPIVQEPVRTRVQVQYNAEAMNELSELLKGL